MGHCDGEALLAGPQRARATRSSRAAQLQVASGALAQCRSDGQRVTVTVVDHARRAKIVLRDDGAAPHTDVHSFRKAYSALTYKMPSAEYGKRRARDRCGRYLRHARQRRRGRARREMRRSRNPEAEALGRGWLV